MHESEISHAIMGAAIEVHRAVGLGNIESSTPDAFRQPSALANGEEFPRAAYIFMRSRVFGPP